MPEKDPNIIVLQNVRLSYPALFKPRSSDDNPQADPKYSAALILDDAKDAAQIKAIQSRIDAIVKEKFKGNAKVLKGTCLRDGAEKDGQDGYGTGTHFVSASSTRRPTVIDAKKQPLTADDNKPYAGCYVHASIRLWPQDNKYGKRVNAELRAVVFSKDGEPLGGNVPVNVDEDFDGLIDATAEDGM
jgi:hypothetical protein